MNPLPGVTLVTYSQTNTIASEIFSDAPLSEGTLAYLEERAKNVFYDYVLTKFKQSGLTKAKLARRLNKKPDQISHALGAPGNWTIGTVTELLAGISREELVPYSVGFANRPPTNVHAVDLLDDDMNRWGTHRSPDPTGTLAPPIPSWDKPAVA
jgi:hypothetical protein